MNSPAESQPLRVLLVEDDALIARGVATSLTAAGLPVVGLCHSGADVTHWLGLAEAADVALVDLGLPDTSGVDVLSELSAERPETSLVAFTQYDDPDHVFGALRAGATGYLLKSITSARLPELLREVAAGGSPLSPSIARRLVGAFAGQERAPLLTSRERDVLALLVDGVTYQEVAVRLDVQLSTVQTHVKSLYKKLRATSRSGAEARARRLGLLR